MHRDKRRVTKKMSIMNKYFLYRSKCWGQ